MGHVSAFEHKHYGLAFPQRDLTRLKCETLCSDLDPLRGIISTSYRRKPNGNQSRSHQHPLNVLPLHNLSGETDCAAWCNLG
jgi:hypothetical protein